MAPRKSKRKARPAGRAAKPAASHRRSKSARRAAPKAAAKRPRGVSAAAKRTARAVATAKRTPRAGAPPIAPPTAAVPNAIGFTNQHMDYTTHDFEGVKRFYTEVLGFTRFQLMPGMQYLAITTGSSSSLGFMPPMPGPPEQWRPPREPNLYLEVADVDRAHRDLVARGVTFEQGPTDMPWGHRVAHLRDPEGRSVTLAQVLKR
jgi:predicted enzyme related to lactoylglutathione lyase